MWMYAMDAEPHNVLGGNTHDVNVEPPRIADDRWPLDDSIVIDVVVYDAWRKGTE
jgi:hypothetical protein